VIDVGTLLALVSGDLAGDELDAVEAHVLGCAACTAEVDAFYAVAAGVWRLVRAGRVRGALTDASVRQLHVQGVPLREYHVGPGEIVACGIGADDRYALVGYQLPGLLPERIDLVVPGSDERLVDVLVDRAAGVLWMLERGDFVRSQPSRQIRLRLVGVAADGEETILADYGLDHTAFSG
jgi:hypothetical protein